MKIKIYSKPMNETHQQGWAWVITLVDHQGRRIAFVGASPSWNAALDAGWIAYRFAHAIVPRGIT